MVKQIRLRPKGTTSVPITDWDNELRTCKGCGAAIYGTNKCCTGDRSPEAFATTANASSVRHDF